MYSKETSVILLTKFKPENVLWGFTHLAFGRYFLGVIPGLKFFKILGSGENAGFSLKPSLKHQGFFCCFESSDFAKEFLRNNPLITKYKNKSEEFFFAELKSFSSRGSWSENTIKESISPPLKGPIASLTRASIRISKVGKFWSLAPSSESSLRSYEGCLLSAGLGEAPLLRQCTFSIWNDIDSLNSYARTGSHLKAIKSANKNKYFSESMFIRFIPINFQGTWQGRNFG